MFLFSKTRASQEFKSRERQRTGPLCPLSMARAEGHVATLPKLLVDGGILVRTGEGLFEITEVEYLWGVPKRISYKGARGVAKTILLKRTLKFSPRGDYLSSGGE